MLLIDDLIQSGGTLIESAKYLRSLGATSVSGFATHGVFPNDSYQKLAAELDMLYVTDSLPENVQRAGRLENMKVISLKPLIEKLIFAE